MKRNLKNIECAYCKKMIRPKNRTTKYCSQECQYKGRRKVRLKNPPNEKRCRNCKKVKHHTEFYANRSSYDLLQCWCKSCQKKKIRKRVYVNYECEICHQLFSRIALSPKAEKTRKNICNLCAVRTIIKNNGGYTLNYTGTMHFSGRTIGAWKHSAKRRGHKWEITNNELEDIYKNQKGLCALSGLEMKGDPKSKFRPSIDRKDSGKGYTTDNVQFVCSIINVMKNKLLDTEFISLCEKVVENKVK